MYISGLGAYLPQTTITTKFAVEHFSYPAKARDKDGYHSVNIENEIYSPQMAKIAALAALKNADLSAHKLRNILYASIHRHGYSRIWNPASYLQYSLNAVNALPLNIQHGCNGGFLALQQIFHATEKKPSELLLVCSDTFNHSGFCRWNADYGLIYGDAATAAVFSTKCGFAEIIHFQTRTIPELEQLHRLEHPEKETATSYIEEYDIKKTKKYFLQKFSKAAFITPILSCLNEMKQQLIDELDNALPIIRWLVTPFVGNSIRCSTYDEVFNPLCQNNFWQYGKYIGHTGASDSLLGLHQQLLQQGDYILLVNAGAGFTCSIMLLKIIHERQNA